MIKCREVLSIFLCWQRWISESLVLEVQQMLLLRPVHVISSSAAFYAFCSYLCFRWNPKPTKFILAGEKGEDEAKRAMFSQEVWENPTVVRLRGKNMMHFVRNLSIFNYQRQRGASTKGTVSKDP